MLGPHEAAAAGRLLGREPGARPCPALMALACPRWLCASLGVSRGLPNLPGDLVQPQLPEKWDLRCWSLSLSPSPLVKTLPTLCVHDHPSVSVQMPSSPGAFAVLSGQGLPRGVERPLVAGATCALRRWPPLGSRRAGHRPRQEGGPGLAAGRRWEKPGEGRPGPLPSAENTPAFSPSKPSQAPGAARLWLLCLLPGAAVAPQPSWPPADRAAP